MSIIDTSPPTFGKTLATFRTMRDMSQAELAERTQVSKGQISRWEIGLAEPRKGSLRRLLEALGTTEQDFEDMRQLLVRRIGAPPGPDSEGPDGPEAGSAGKSSRVHPLHLAAVLIDEVSRDFHRCGHRLGLIASLLRGEDPDALQEIVDHIAARLEETEPADES